MADQSAQWLGSINIWLKDISASVGRALGTVFAPTVTLDDNTVSLASNTRIIIQGITDVGETVAIEVGPDGHLPVLTYSEFMIHLGRSGS